MFNSILRLGLKIARSPIGRIIFRWAFSTTKIRLPLSQLRENENVIAFFHPDPSYPFHVLIVPKRPIASIMELKHNEYDCLVDVFEIAKSLVQEYQLDEHGYRLIVNSGKYQEVSQLHFHLVTEFYSAK